MSIFFCVVIAVYMVILNSEQLPSWTAPQPNGNEPLGGYTLLPNRTNIEIFHGTSPNDTSLISGAYNHAPMISFYENTFIVLWKNCQQNEDCNGQRILFSQSVDGINWSYPQIMFPNMSVPQIPATLFVGPPIIINGHLYAAASPGKSADGTQFCLWPEPLTTSNHSRNCGPPQQPQYNNTLLMRRVYKGIDGNIGSLFWANNVPKQYEEITKILNISSINEMDIETQNDIYLLTKEMDGFCNTMNENTSSTLKCEVCENGCQLYSDIDKSLNIKNERSHYIVPSNKMDILLYRQSKYQLYASIRNISYDINTNKTIFGNWSYPKLTNIPNDDTNLNCGSLPNNKIYLISNPLYPNATEIERINGLLSPKQRDPMTIATSIDGFIFDKVGVIMTCTNLSETSLCTPRYQGKGINNGPSYPQALTVIHPAPINIQGLYVVASNNKEDIWITHVPFSALP